ncbi:hypothetical protein CAC42_5736 [Sphaceloma murrayae]|uniref:GPI-anchored surface protein n=1 Tax=Sphaceloma murrayae TaxID=2082308 RepID=A0A2K1QZ06_9PEZI|nr:hypothetical protein CAC42_5736 [Sphaceloma murrayae]
MAGTCRRYQFSTVTIAVVLHLTTLVAAQNSWYCGAVSLQSAAQAQCPSWATVSCSDVGAAGHCCPSGTTCGWGGGAVGCCSHGQQCYGQPGAAIQQEPRSWVATSSYYPQRTECYNDCDKTTVLVPVATTVVQQPTVTFLQSTTTGVVGVGVPFTTNIRTATVVQGFCSTQVASGPGLPTTAQGDCGTILIVAGAPPKMSLRPGLWLIPLVYVLSLAWM